MPEALTGNLTQMSPLEVIRLMNLGKKTGRLEFVKEKEIAELFFRNGELFHARCTPLEGERVIFYVIQWETGTFKFYVNETIDEKNIKEDIEEILKKAQVYLSRIKEIKSVISSPNIVFRLKEDSGESEISLKPADWKILTYINGKNTVNDIVNSVDMGELEVHTRLYRLYRAGLIEKIGITRAEIVAPSSDDEIIPSQFFDIMERELTRLLGPIAQVLMEEYLEQYGIPKEKFPKRLGGELVDKISLEITDEDERLLFQQRLLALL